MALENTFDMAYALKRDTTSILINQISFSTMVKSHSSFDVVTKAACTTKKKAFITCNQSIKCA